MTPHWYAPHSVWEWVKRCCCFINVFIVCVVVALGASELRFDWAEKLVGGYLMSINAQRPETGSIWESGRHARNAHQSLNKIIDQKEEILKVARQTASFSALVRQLGAGEWVNLGKDQFKTLYDELPFSVKHRLIDPVRLVWLLGTDVVDRIFCEGQIEGIKIYFIDSDNRVVEQVELTPQVLTSQNASSVLAQRLEDQPGYANRIYPAQQFFDALFSLPQDMIQDLVPDTRELLAQEGTLVQVGLWDTAQDGFIPMGFEFAHLGRHRVIQVQAREWAVWQLSMKLKGRVQ